MRGMNSIIGILPCVHYLKIDAVTFQIIKNGDKQLKTKANKDYKVGDTLIIDELNSSKRHSGDWTAKEIIRAQAKEDYVILGLKDIKL